MQCFNNNLYINCFDTAKTKQKPLTVNTVVTLHRLTVYHCKEYLTMVRNSLWVFAQSTLHRLMILNFYITPMKIERWWGTLRGYWHIVIYGDWKSSSPDLLFLWLTFFITCIVGVIFLVLEVCDVFNIFFPSERLKGRVYHPEYHWTDLQSHQ